MNGAEIKSPGCLFIMACFIFGWPLGIFSVILGFICPPVWIASCILFAGPIYVTLSRYGACPYCGSELEVLVHKSGTKCKSCGHGVRIANGRAWQINTVSRSNAQVRVSKRGFAR